MEIGLLLSDAEMGEDLAKDFVGGEFAGDGAKVGEGRAKILGDELC